MLGYFLCPERSTSCWLLPAIGLDGHEAALYIHRIHPRVMMPRSAEACSSQHAILGPPLASQTDRTELLLRLIVPFQDQFEDAARLCWAQAFERCRKTRALLSRHMQPDSDGPETSQAFPIASGRPALIPETSQKAFSSFDFAAFQASTSDQTKADANAKGEVNQIDQVGAPVLCLSQYLTECGKCAAEAQLQQAAQYFLSSSDDDDASEDNAQPERNKNAADARSSKPEKKRKRKYRRYASHPFQNMQT